MRYAPGFHDQAVGVLRNDSIVPMFESGLASAKDTNNAMVNDFRALALERFVTV